MTRIAGYAAVWDRADRAGDVIRRGAFADAEEVRLLHQHRGDPVGTVEAIAEDERGLRVTAKLTDPAVARAVRSGALPGLSVGYHPVAVRQGARRELLRVTLAEVSLVAVPMQPLARIDHVSCEENGNG